MLVLIDADHTGASDEGHRIRGNGVASGHIIEVDHSSSQSIGELTQQRGLADRSRPLEQEHRLILEALECDLRQPAVYQAGQSLFHRAILPPSDAELEASLLRNWRRVYCGTG